MRNLMKRFDVSKEEKWKILSCPTAGGQTALHIAVMEGNTRAAIMLLDFADETKTQLLQVTDNTENTAEEFASEFSVLGTVLSLSTIFEDPSLHIAAWRDDRFLLSALLEIFPDNAVTKINQKNSEGFTVFHVASIASSSNVIKQLSKELSADDFLTSAMEFSEDGQAAIHLAVMKNNPSSVHALLAATSDEGRRKLLSSRNQSGQNAMELAEKNLADGCRNVLHCK